MTMYCITMCHRMSENLTIYHPMELSAMLYIWILGMDLIHKEMCCQKILLIHTRLQERLITRIMSQRMKKILGNSQ